MLYLREDIPSKSLIEIKLDNEIENIFIEINLRSKKWLVSGSYSPKLSHIKNHLQEIGKGLDYYSSKYENFIVLGDFNAEMSNSHISEFCAIYNFTNLVKGMLRRYIGHFLKKRKYEKIRTFWNELTEKNLFFYFKRSLFLIFLKL